MAPVRDEVATSSRRLPPGSLDRGAELWLRALGHVGDYLTCDVDPRGSNWHVGLLLASVIHPDAVALRDERRRQIARHP